MRIIEENSLDTLDTAPISLDILVISILDTPWTVSSLCLDTLRSGRDAGVREALKSASTSPQDFLKLFRNRYILLLTASF